MTQQINLYNPDLIPRQHPFSTIGLAIMLAVAVAGMLLIQIYSLYTKDQLEQDSAVISELLQRENGQLEKIRTLLAQRPHDPQLAAETRGLEAELKARQEAVALLKAQAHGEDHRGFSPLFSALARQIVDGVWITGVAIGAQREMALTGRALSGERVPHYLQKLKNEPALRGHTFDQFEIVPGATVQGRSTSYTPYIEFKLGVWPKGGADETPSATPR